MSTKDNFAHASQLRAMAHEMLALADRIEEKYTLRQSRVMVYEFASMQALAASASKQLCDRQRRQASFENLTEIFGEPAWDMLLYLFVRGCEKKRVRKTDLTSVSGAAHSTAMRYVEVLADAKLIEVERCDTDHRVQFISLTVEGKVRMSNCLSRQMRVERNGLEDLNGGPVKVRGAVLPSDIAAKGN